MLKYSESWEVDIMDNPLCLMSNLRHLSRSQVVFIFVTKFNVITRHSASKNSCTYVFVRKPVMLTLYAHH